MAQFDWRTLHEACQWYVAREIARGRVRNKNYNAWRVETEKAMPEALEKLNAMSNFELLELIGKALDSYA